MKDETLIILGLVGLGVFMLMRDQLKGLPTGTIPVTSGPPPAPGPDPNSGAGQAIGIINSVGDAFGQLGDAFGAFAGSFKPTGTIGAGATA